MFEKNVHSTYAKPLVGLLSMQLQNYLCECRLINWIKLVQNVSQTLENFEKVTIQFKTNLYS